MDQIIGDQDIYHDPKKERRRRNIWLACVAAACLIISIPFVSQLFTYRRGLVTTAGSEYFITARFNAADLSRINLDLNEVAINITTHNADTVRFTTGSGVTLRYIYDPAAGTLRIIHPMPTGLETATRRVVNIAIPENSNFENFHVNMRHNALLGQICPHGRVNISGNFQNLQISAPHAYLEGVRVENNLDISVRDRISLSGVVYNPASARINSVSGQISRNP